MPSKLIQGKLHITSNNKKERYTAYVNRVARFNVLKPSVFFTYHQV